MVRYLSAPGLMHVCPPPPPSDMVRSITRAKYCSEWCIVTTTRILIPVLYLGVLVSALGCWISHPGWAVTGLRMKRCGSYVRVLWRQATTPWTRRCLSWISGRGRSDSTYFNLGGWCRGRGGRWERLGQSGAIRMWMDGCICFGKSLDLFVNKGRSQQVPWTIAPKTQTFDSTSPVVCSIKW